MSETIIGVCFITAVVAALTAVLFATFVIWERSRLAAAAFYFGGLMLIVGGIFIASELIWGPIYTWDTQ